MPYRRWRSMHVNSGDDPLSAFWLMIKRMWKDIAANIGEG